MTTAGELEAVLRDHEAALEAIERNLVELEMDPSATLVRATTFAGATAERLGAPIERLGELWQHAALYRTAVTEARRVADGQGWLRGGRLDELDALLNDRSIVIDAEVVPILARSLTGADRVEQRVSLGELLDAMHATFDDVRLAVAAIDAAWTRLRRGHEDIAAELARLRAEAPAGVRPRVDRLAEHAADLQRDGLTDPLAARARLDRLEANVDAESRLLAEWHRDRRDALERLTALRHAATTVTSQIDEADRLASRCRERIAGAADLTVSPPARNDVADVVSALDRADAMAADGDWSDCRRELARLEPRCRDLGRLAADAIAANGAPLAERDELRGLLDAALAKARSRMVPEGPVADLGSRAHDALHTAPCDLTRARLLVYEFLDGLRAVATTDEGGH